MTNYEIIQEVNKGLPELLNTEPVTKVVYTAMQRAIELTRNDDVENTCKWLLENFYHEETMVDCIAYKHEDVDVNKMIKDFKKTKEEVK